MFTFQSAEFLTLFFLLVDGFIPGAVQAHHCDPDIRKCDQADRSTAQVSARLSEMQLHTCVHECELHIMAHVFAIQRDGTLMETVH